MKCLMRYRWVKLLRSHLPQGKGIMSAWAKLTSRAAYRKGNATYCGYTNAVEPGMWSGGVVGLKSILGVRNRSQALETLDKLSELGYIKYELDSKTKKLTYKITDWVVECSGKECPNGTVYATNGYGFLCVPRNITDRLVGNNYIFNEADSWLDLWCHTVTMDQNNAFSYLAPVVQYGNHGAVFSLETLGKRWSWEKTKVWRFFKKYGDVFSLYRLPGSYGCLIFNKLYPTDTEVSLPTQEQIEEIFNIIRANCMGSGREWFNRAVVFCSRLVIRSTQSTENRVAHSDHIIRAYISLCWNCINYKNCIYDCRSVNIYTTTVTETDNIRGPCAAANKIAKELLTYDYYYDTG